MKRQEMNVDNGQKNYILGFFSLYEMPSKDGYMGSILITDAQSVPLEFRCTHPIKPNIVQRKRKSNFPLGNLNLLYLPIIQISKMI